MAYRDRLPGGLADKRRPSDFDQKALRQGIKVELEHTNDPEIAREIAMDHLTEDRAYYEKLAMIEKNLENPIGGVGTALIVGGVALLGWLIFAKKSPIAPAAAATPATCPLDAHKLDRWGQARGFPVVYFALTKVPPTPEEFFSGVDAPVLDVGEQAVAVLADGSFWYYTQSEISPGVPLTGRADNLRADYCAFPNAEPPSNPPPPPPATEPSTTQGLAWLGQTSSELPPESSWQWTVSQYYAWNVRRQVWDLIGTAPAIRLLVGNKKPAVQPGTSLQFIDYYFGGASLYANSWIAEITWIYAQEHHPLIAPGNWFKYHVQVDKYEDGRWYRNLNPRGAQRSGQ